MKKKKIAVILCTVLLLCLGLYFGSRYRELNRVSGYQPMRIMVDGSMYVHKGAAQQERPQGQPDGVITEIIAPSAYPQKDGQANFGTVGTPFWNIGHKIVVESGRYYIFDQLQYQE